LAWREGQTPLSRDQLLELLAELDQPLRQANQISRDDQRHWQLVWFDAHRSQAWRAQFLRWLRPQDRLGLVHLPDLAMDLVAECHGDRDPGDALLVRLQLVDPLRDLLRFTAAG